MPEAKVKNFPDQTIKENWAVNFDRRKYILVITKYLVVHILPSQRKLMKWRHIKTIKITTKYKISLHFDTCGCLLVLS